MATRIRPRPAPAEPVSPRLEPGATLLLAPPHNLNKRLTAAVHRSLPGWTVEVLVKRWTDDEAHVILKGTRDPGSGAPPAPPTDSPAARKIENRTSGVLERIVEAAHPGVDWSAASQYKRLDANHIAIGLIAKPHDPPTCPDGGVVAFAGAENYQGDDDKITLKSHFEKGALEGDRWVFFHRYRKPSFLTAGGPPVQSWVAYKDGWPTNAVPVISPPTLVSGGQIMTPTNDETFASKIAAGGDLVLQVGLLADWWVWWNPD